MRWFGLSGGVKGRGSNFDKVLGNKWTARCSNWIHTPRKWLHIEKLKILHAIFAWIVVLFATAQNRNAKWRNHLTRAHSHICTSTQSDCECLFFIIRSGCVTLIQPHKHSRLDRPAIVSKVNSNLFGLCVSDTRASHVDPKIQAFGNGTVQ